MGIPSPEPGLVLHYSYLWHDEHLAGREEGRKDRPCAVILTESKEENEITIVTILPITHSKPADPNIAVEIPLSIKRHLGLDDDRSWIVLSEVNEFFWPGYDLRKVPETGKYEYGFLPPNFFLTVRDAFVRFYKTGRTKRTVRI